MFPLTYFLTELDKKILDISLILIVHQNHHLTHPPNSPNSPIEKDHSQKGHYEHFKASPLYPH